MRAAKALPYALGLAFVLVVLLLFGDRLWPARAVEVTTVVTHRTTPDEAAETRASAPRPTRTSEPYAAPTLFQASGWLEADPLPVKATALVAGVVESVHVLEGERVEKGQLLATLIPDDTALDLATAESALAAVQAELAAVKAEQTVLAARHETLRQRIAVAQARQAERADDAERLAAIGGEAVPERQISQARLALATAAAEVIALQATEAELAAEEQRLDRRGEMLAARVRQAEVEVDRRQLAHDRTRITAPLAGIVQHLHVVPGQKRMLAMESPDSATIVEIFDPANLQARIDVPLAEAGAVRVGQAVNVRTNILPDTVFRGTLTRIVGQADLQRNTLQVKVALHEPDPRLRPEMLCRAEFLDAQVEGAGSEALDSDVARGRVTGNDAVALYVPTAALINLTSNEAHVWTLVADDRRVERRAIRLGREERDGFRAVREGLRPGDRVVLNPPSDLADGERVAARFTR